MKLNDEELTLIEEALDHYSYNNHGPTKTDEINTLGLRFNKQLTAHNWKMVGSPGMYDNSYQCTKCGRCESESTDSSYRKPEFGCIGEKT